MAHQLSPQQIAAFENKFRQMDTNGDGTVTKEELADAMRNSGQNPTDEAVQQVMNGVDTDGNGRLDMAEFVKSMAKMIGCSRPPPPTDLLDQFRAFDRDGNGLITNEELREVMKAAGQANMTEEESSMMIKAADTDHDGYVNYAEFIKMMGF